MQQPGGATTTVDHCLGSVRGQTTSSCAWSTGCSTG